MAGNSVPVFFGAKARTKKPPGLDVTSITDLSRSMQRYASFISSSATIQALENALVAQGVGTTATNRYSFASGAGRFSYSTLSSIERNVVVDGVSQRWAAGASVLDESATLPTLVADLGGDTENMGRATNLMTQNDRGYSAGNERIIIAGSDEQDYFDSFSTSPIYPHRYVGVHQVILSVNEPAGPNPAPAGLLIGFVYTTNTVGAAIYNDNGTLRYRLEVPVANMVANATGGTLQLNVNHARNSNGAIYDIDIDYDLLGESLGTVLGSYLFEVS